MTLSRQQTIQWMGMGLTAAGWTLATLTLKGAPRAAGTGYRSLLCWRKLHPWQLSCQ